MSVSITLHSGTLGEAFNQALHHLAEHHIAERIAKRDHTVWRPQPDEISNRLGWLDCPHTMPDNLHQIDQVVQQARRDGLHKALLLGMGGSSLAPEVFRKVFGVTEGYLDLHVLDSTHPDAVLAQATACDPATTLYIPATKSGGTVETLSFLKYFYRQAVQTLGADQAGQHFVAITDPGSGLADLAGELNFRHIFLNDPHIGGRYSALSHFGLVPAALIGADPNSLLQRAAAAATIAEPAIQLGAFMGAGVACGRDKLTLLASEPLTSVGAWIEQLIAESTGKQGKGILPVDGEQPLDATAYGDDRLFVHVRIDESHDDQVDALIAAGLPLLQLTLDGKEDLGAAFYYWEVATAIAGHLMDIHPFDQPDVEAAKALARDMVQTYMEQGALPAEQSACSAGPLTVYGAGAPTTPLGALETLWSGGDSPAQYVAIQAYLPSTPELESLIGSLRRVIYERSGMATTLGYGPRFLHSTGQLHKGDAGRGLFLQLTADSKTDAPIPDTANADASSLSFGVLLAAQAHGDGQALRQAGRTTLRLHLGEDAASGLHYLLAQFAQK